MVLHVEMMKRCFGMKNEEKLAGLLPVLGTDYSRSTGQQKKRAVRQQMLRFPRNININEVLVLCKTLVCALA